MDHDLAAKLAKLENQISAYRDEAQRATRPRRQIIGRWAAIAAIWLATGSVMIVAIITLAEKTAGINDGKLALVVVVCAVAAIVATLLVVARDDSH